MKWLDHQHSETGPMCHLYTTNNAIKLPETHSLQPQYPDMARSGQQKYAQTDYIWKQERGKLHTQRQKLKILKNKGSKR